MSLWIPNWAEITEDYQEDVDLGGYSWSWAFLQEHEYHLLNYCSQNEYIQACEIIDRMLKHIN